MIQYLILATLFLGAVMFGLGIGSAEAGRMTVGNAWLAVSGMALIAAGIISWLVFAVCAMG